MHQDALAEEEPHEALYGPQLFGNGKKEHSCCASVFFEETRAEGELGREEKQGGGDVAVMEGDEEKMHAMPLEVCWNLSTENRGTKVSSCLSTGNGLSITTDAPFGDSSKIEVCKTLDIENNNYGRSYRGSLLQDSLSESFIGDNGEMWNYLDKDSNSKMKLEPDVGLPQIGSRASDNRHQNPASMAFVSSHEGDLFHLPKTVDSVGTADTEDGTRRVKDSAKFLDGDALHTGVDMESFMTGLVEGTNTAMIFAKSDGNIPQTGVDIGCSMIGILEGTGKVMDLAKLDDGDTKVDMLPFTATNSVTCENGDAFCTGLDMIPSKPHHLEGMTTAVGSVKVQDGVEFHTVGDVATSVTSVVETVRETAKFDIGEIEGTGTAVDPTISDKNMSHIGQDIGPPSKDTQYTKAMDGSGSFMGTLSQACDSLDVLLTALQHATPGEKHDGASQVIHEAFEVDCGAKQVRFFLETSVIVKKKAIRRAKNVFKEQDSQGNLVSRLVFFEALLGDRWGNNKKVNNQSRVRETRRTHVSKRPQRESSLKLINVSHLKTGKPLVLSKRGRSQVLPTRFSDSIIQPWKRASKGRHKSKLV